MASNDYCSVNTISHFVYSGLPVLPLVLIIWVDRDRVIIHDDPRVSLIGAACFLSHNHFNEISKQG